MLLTFQCWSDQNKFAEIQQELKVLLGGFRVNIRLVTENQLSAVACRVGFNKSNKLKKENSIECDYIKNLTIGKMFLYLCDYFPYLSTNHFKPATAILCILLIVR